MPTYDLNTVEGILSALNINPAWSTDRREEAIKLECANYNALVEISSALNCASPSSIDRVREIVSAVWTLKHKSSEVAAVARHDGGLAEELKAKIASNVADAAARDMRIADLEAAIEATHKVFDGVGVAWSVGDDAGRLPLPKRAEYAVSPGFLADTERKALEARIADLERDIAAKDTSLKTANAALKRICEVIGAPVPVCPDDAVEAVKTLLCESEGHNARADRAEATLAEMVKAIDDAGAPKVYTLDDDTGRPIPDPERIRLLGERVRALRAQLREATDATTYLDAIIEAHNALDALGAPRLADGTALTAAARIRAIPR